MYDFEKYYADMNIKAEVNLDLSGVQIENPEGTPNEHVSNNVVYYVTGIKLSNDPEFVDSEEIGINDRVMVTVKDESAPDTNTSYFALFQPLSDVLSADVASEWHPEKDKETQLDLDSSDDGTQITYTSIHDGKYVTIGEHDANPAGMPDRTYAYARVFITPRYEFITGDGHDDVLAHVAAGDLGPLKVNQNVISNDSGTDSLPATMQMIYALLGLNGKRKCSMRNIRKLASGKKTKNSAVIGYDLLRKRLKSISSWCAENNYGVDVKYYDSSMSKPLPEGVEDATSKEYRTNRRSAREKHYRYLLACREADITRTSMPRYTSFEAAYKKGGYLDSFMNNDETGPLVDDIRSTGLGVTALIPPIKDAVKGIFYPKEDIENDFYEQFESVYNDLREAISIMRIYLNNRTKSKIYSIGRKFKTHPSDNAHLAFDMDSLFNYLFDNYKAMDDSLDNRAIYATGTTYDVEEITAYPRVFEINGSTIYAPGTGVAVDASWGVSAFSTGTKTLYPHWAFNGSDDYTTSNYKWNKAVSELNWDEVLELLVDAYNWILKKNDIATIVIDSDLAGLLEKNDTYFAGGYNSLMDIGVSPQVKQCKRFIEFVAGWMNLFRKLGGMEAASQFIEEHPLESGETVMRWLNRLVMEGVTIDGEPAIDWNLHGTYNVLIWEKCSNKDDGKIDFKKFKPSYEPGWGVDPESPADIDAAVEAAFVMKRAYKEMRSQLITRAFLMTSVRVVRAWLAMEDASESIGELNETIDRIIWYQAFVNESVFTNKSMYLDKDVWLKCDSGGDDDDDYVQTPFTPWTLPARFMIPVAMYRKVRKRYKILGFTRHKTVKVYDGVRWAEVRFYDLNVYNEYPVIEDTPGNTVELGKPATVEEVDGKWIVNFDEPLPEEIWNAGTGELLFDDMSETTLQVVFDGDMAAHVPDGVETTIVGEHTVKSVKVPPERSRNDSDQKTPVTVHVRAPGLPYDEEIRKRAFAEYGPFSQDKYFEVVRYGDGGFPNIPEDQRFDGWKVFRNTSRKIEDMREGFGLYDKVAFLISILKHEFGANRVELINTWRSEEDQKGICTGGLESSMLSWHNYGMAAKILIYQNDCTTPIVDKSDDMKRLVKVARAFTDICASGRIGNPCNVVWCGRLVVNPSLFDWEFLPIGVGHKDAFRFREAIMAQKDPIKECAYVDVDAAGFARYEAPDDGSPFVLVNSSTYRNATIINGHHYIAPDRIRNYRTPSDIVLYDLVEYIDLINLKMNANGNKLGERGNIYEWKSINDASCVQLIRYFALTGNIKAAKALIAGDFVDKYQAIEDAYYSSSVIDYVKNMLGSHYEDAYISVDLLNDAGFISLSNGKMYIKAHDIIPDNVATMADMHGQQRVDNNHIKRGVWRKGIFYGLDEIDIPYTETETPVIEGYVDGQASYGEAMYLHQAVASELHDAFLQIRGMFERYQGAVMYDRFQDGPYASKFDQLENEFGAIAAQDLMDFDDLEAIMVQDDINRLTEEEVGDGDIYEKVVNNAQLAGMRRAAQTSERMHITDKGNGLTPGEIYRAVMEGRAPGANDLMSGR